MLKIKSASLYIAFAIAVGLLAKGRGRGGFRWTLLALVVSPLIAGGIVLLLPRGECERNFLA